MRHFDAWVVRDPYSIFHYYSTGERWQDTIRCLIQERKICSPIPDSERPAIDPYTKALNSQPNCSLLQRLPLEIRHMIWGYVFGSETIHLVNVKDKIRHVRCSSGSQSSLTHHRHCCPLTPARWRVFGVSGHSDSLLYPHTHHALLESLSDSGAALLRTCRAIYAETANILYRYSNFDVDDLYTFIAFAKTIGPYHLGAIRRLTVQWTPMWQPLTGKDHTSSVYAHTHSDALWTQFWALVSSLPSLQYLDLSLDLGRFTGAVTGGGTVVVAGQRLPLVLTETWLLPLLNVRGLKDFELAITARCDTAAKGVIEDDLVRDAGLLKDQLKAVMCLPASVPLENIKELGLANAACALDALKDEPVRRSGPRLAITAA